MDSDDDRDLRIAISLSLAIAQKESFPKVSEPSIVKVDWSCHVCTFLNVEGSSQCAICNASRNLNSYFSSQELQRAESSPQASISKEQEQNFLQEGWSCLQCSFLNALNCEKCGNPRKFDGTEMFSSQPKVISSNSENMPSFSKQPTRKTASVHKNPSCNEPMLNSDKVEWACLRCTLLNSQASLCCEACGMCKPEPALTQNVEEHPKRLLLNASKSVEQDENNQIKRRVGQDEKQMPSISCQHVQEKCGTVGILRAELQLGEQIGEGSFGVVRKARWGGIDVAVKELKDVTCDIMDEFRREAHVLSRVRNHSCVVQLLGVTFLPNPALVTQYLPNGSVEDILIKNNDAIQYRLVVRMAIEACSGLQHLHNEGVIHRDLAARNLLVDKEFHVQVSDFGLARVKNASESKGYSKSATIPLKWSAPEAMEKKEYSEKSDVFSFGVVMYEMFMRQSPWKKMDHFEASCRVCNGERMELPDALDSDMRDLIGYCWSHEKYRRPKVPEILHFLKVYIRSPKIPAERTLIACSNQNNNEHSLHTYLGFTLRLL